MRSVMTRLLPLALLCSALTAETRFERDVLPIFTANCLSCHGGTSMVGLDLRTASSALRGSHQGRVVVVVDQFEEIVTACRDQEERERFAGALAAILKTS